MPQNWNLQAANGSEQDDEWVRSGIDAHVSNNLPLAQHRYQQALRLNPRNAVATHNLAIIFAQSPGFLNEALLTIERAELMDGVHGFVKATWAQIAAEAELIDVALVKARAAVEIDPGINSKLVLALLLATAGCAEEAVKLYNEILDKEPTHQPSGTNACLPYDERVNTTEGLIPIGEIVRRMNAEGRRYEVFDREGRAVQVVAAICNGKKHIARLQCYDGTSLILTYDHVVFVEQEDGSVVEKCAGDLIPGSDRLIRSRAIDLIGGNPKAILAGIELTDELAWAAGIMVGDGFSDRPQSSPTDIWEVKVNTVPQRALIEKILTHYGVTFSTTEFHWGFTIRGYGTTGHRFWESLDLWGRTNAKIIPEWVYRAGGSVARNFLAGLYDADGCVHEHGINLSNTSLDIIEGAQTLLRCMGIQSFQIAYNGGLVESLDSDEDYIRKDHWHLNTYDLESVKRFHELIPLVHENKSKRLELLASRIRQQPRRCRPKASLVTSRDKASIVQVYDIQTASGHFWASGQLVHNCFVQTLTPATPADLLKQRQRYYHTHRFMGKIEPHDNDRTLDRTLRVGYVGGDFKTHSASLIFRNVLWNHSPAVEMYLYSSLPVDPEKDGATKKYMELAGNRWRDISAMSDEEAARLIRRDRIDILVDLAGHTAGGRLTLFTRKPAPVQVTAWGFAHGTGIPEIDYFFADPIAVPEEERQHFAEKIIDLPCIITIGEPVEYNLKGVSSAPYRKNDYITFGSYARYEKMSEECLKVFSEIMRRVPDSRMQFKDASYRRPHAIKRILNIMEGIAPERLLFSIATSHPDHMLAYQQSDLMLDPWPHGGGVVTVEQLYMGVPVLTLYGKQAAGRSMSSVLTAMGRTDWIAKTPEEYVEKAVAMAENPKVLAEPRKTLRDELLKSKVIVGYVEVVERRYAEIWSHWCKS